MLFAFLTCSLIDRLRPLLLLSPIHVCFLISFHVNYVTNVTLINFILNSINCAQAAAAVSKCTESCPNDSQKIYIYIYTFGNIYQNANQSINQSVMRKNSAGFSIFSLCLPLSFDKSTGELPQCHLQCTRFALVITVK